MTNDGEDMHKYCQFPFKYQGKEHSACISDHSKEGKGRFWCATEVKFATNEILKGRKGYCEPTCPTENNSGFRNSICQDSTFLCAYLKPQCEKKDVQKSCPMTCGSCNGQGKK